MGVMVSWEVSILEGGCESVLVVEVESDLAGSVMVRIYASADLVMLAARSSMLICRGGASA